MVMSVHKAIPIIYEPPKHSMDAAWMVVSDLALDLVQLIAQVTEASKKVKSLVLDFKSMAFAQEAFIGQLGGLITQDVVAALESNKFANEIKLYGLNSQKMQVVGTTDSLEAMVMAEGIEASNDPVLRFRSPAYAISFGKRLSGQ